MSLPPHPPHPLYPNGRHVSVPSLTAAQFPKPPTSLSFPAPVRGATRLGRLQPASGSDVDEHYGRSTASQRDQLQHAPLDAVAHVLEQHYGLGHAAPPSPNTHPLLNRPEARDEPGPAHAHAHAHTRLPVIRALWSPTRARAEACPLPLTAARPKASEVRAGSRPALTRSMDSDASVVTVTATAAEVYTKGLRAREALAIQAAAEPRDVQEWGFFLKCYAEGRYNLSHPPEPPPRKPSFRHLPAPAPASESTRIQVFRRMNVPYTGWALRQARHLVMQGLRALDTEHAALSFFDRRNEIMRAESGYNRAVIPRAESIGAHVLLSTEALVVLDTHQDWRFQGNALVQEAPFIRFYAAAPLTTADGHVVGAFAVFDSAPRAALSLRLRQKLVSCAKAAMADFQQLVEHAEACQAPDRRIRLHADTAETDDHDDDRTHRSPTTSMTTKIDRAASHPSLSLLSSSSSASSSAPAWLRRCSLSSACLHEGARPDAARSLTLVESFSSGARTMVDPDSPPKAITTATKPGSDLRRGMVTVRPGGGPPPPPPMYDPPTPPDTPDPPRPGSKADDDDDDDDDDDAQWWAKAFLADDAALEPGAAKPVEADDPPMALHHHTRPHPHLHPHPDPSQNVFAWSSAVQQRVVSAAYGLTTATTAAAAPGSCPLPLPLPHHPLPRSYSRPHSLSPHPPHPAPPPPPPPPPSPPAPLRVRKPPSSAHLPTTTTAAAPPPPPTEAQTMLRLIAGRLGWDFVYVLRILPLPLPLPCQPPVTEVDAGEGRPSPLLDDDDDDDRADRDNRAYTHLVLSHGAAASSSSCSSSSPQSPLSLPPLVFGHGLHRRALRSAGGLIYRNRDDHRPDETPLVDDGVVDGTGMGTGTARFRVGVMLPLVRDRAVVGDGGGGVGGGGVGGAGGHGALVGLGPDHGDLAALEPDRACRSGLVLGAFRRGSGGGSGGGAGSGNGSGSGGGSGKGSGTTMVSAVGGDEGRRRAGGAAGGVDDDDEDEDVDDDADDEPSLKDITLLREAGYQLRNVLGRA
ncbi:MAG: hypothetical protein M1826_002382 [Phylliscum demangeonii]|nr:MAG: hypothetical protein M1826_002382 [Phylliscum demangeonii]